MTMELKRIALLIAICLQVLPLAAAPRIVCPGVKSPTTFAIFIDSRSYDAAAAEVDAYRAAVERDGLGTYLLIDEWQSPESVRSEIIRMTEAQPPLEGVVFIGDIPVAMIRDGQHLTSAFKSSQDRDWKDSSVPSDRYYDDPGRNSSSCAAIPTSRSTFTTRSRPNRASTSHRRSIRPASSRPNAKARIPANSCKPTCARW